MLTIFGIFLAFKNGFIWNIFSSLSLNSGLPCNAQVLNNSLMFLCVCVCFSNGRKRSVAIFVHVFSGLKIILCPSISK